MLNLSQEIWQQAADAIREADALFIGAGAGMGVDSGLPDFRGDQGFWKAYPPFRKQGLSFIDLANPQWFAKDPMLAWGFYGHRLHLYRNTQPHDGFSILLNWGQQLPAGYFVYTSNVDGQFQKAGFDANHILECHGSLHHLQCTTTCKQEIWDASKIEVAVDETSFRAKAPLPRCQHCGQLARPNLLMFGDWHWNSHRTDRQERRLDDWLKTRHGQKIVIIECGAGTAIPSVRVACEQIAKTHNGTLIRINPREAHGPPNCISISTGALEALQTIHQNLTQNPNI